MNRNVFDSVNQNTVQPSCYKRIANNALFHFTKNVVYLSLNGGNRVPYAGWIHFLFLLSYSAGKGTQMQDSEAGRGKTEKHIY